MSEMKFFATHVPAAPGFMLVSTMHEASGELSEDFCLMPIIAWLVESKPVTLPGQWEDFHSVVTPLTPEGKPAGNYAIWCPLSKQYLLPLDGAFDRAEDLMAYFKSLEKK